MINILIMNIAESSIMGYLKSASFPNLIYVGLSPKIPSQHPFDFFVSLASMYLGHTMQGSRTICSVTREKDSQEKNPSMFVTFVTSSVALRSLRWNTQCLQDESRGSHPISTHFVRASHPVPHPLHIPSVYRVLYLNFPPSQASTIRARKKLKCVLWSPSLISIQFNPILSFMISYDAEDLYFASCIRAFEELLRWIRHPFMGFGNDLPYSFCLGKPCFTSLVRPHSKDWKNDLFGNAWMTRSPEQYAAENSFFVFVKDRAETLVLKNGKQDGVCLVKQHHHQSNIKCLKRWKMRRNFQSLSFHLNNALHGFTFGPYLCSLYGNKDGHLYRDAF